MEIKRTALVLHSAMDMFRVVQDVPSYPEFLSWCLGATVHEETPEYQLASLFGAVERKGYTLIPTAMYWSRGRAKVEIGLAKGKRQHDKRRVQKDRDWARQKARIMKHG